MPLGARLPPTAIRTRPEAPADQSGHSHQLAYGLTSITHLSSCADPPPDPCPCSPFYKTARLLPAPEDLLKCLSTGLCQGELLSPLGCWHFSLPDGGRALGSPDPRDFGPKTLVTAAQICRTWATAFHSDDLLGLGHLSTSGHLVIGTLDGLPKDSGFIFFLLI